MGDMFEIKETQERAILVGIKRANDPVPLDVSLAELARLVETDGATVVAQSYQRLETPNPRTFVGSGKVQELDELCKAYGADILIFDDELSPSQQSNLERSVDKSIKVIDRTALILDIFALHAKTREGKLQVRLAQNEYLYPRLRGMWAHLASNRMGGGVGSRFGEGESQLEVDRRMVRKRISTIKKELAKLEDIRTTQREKRRQSGIFRVALAGYTNAGKSSLINSLTKAEVFSMDQLFATLDSTTRKLKLPEGREVTITDTIGFIRKLPTTLVESFKSTLDEINEAHLVLHVIDASSSEINYQIDTVEEVLNQIGAANIDRIEVFNKIDLISAEERSRIQATHPEAILVSSLTGENTQSIIERIGNALAAQDKYTELIIPYERGDLLALAHRKAQIVRESFEDDGVHIALYLPKTVEYAFTTLIRP